MLSIGALLASEREKRGIPVEKAAKETRMRPQRIRDMEGDDLSHFTNPSYARMFIIAYAKYLGIPMKTIRDHLPDRGEPGTEGYQYISTSTEQLPSLRHDIASKPARRNTLLYSLTIATLAVLLVGHVGGLSWVYINAPRLAKNANEAKQPAAPDPTPLPAPAPVVVIKQDIVLANLQPNGTKSEAFGSDVAIAAPPAPTPAAMVDRKTLPKLNVTVGPAAPQSDDDDRAFLLGSSPDQKPATVQ